VAAIPDLNELVSSLDPAEFQFISVDDEQPKVVEGFLAKRKMAGWVGIDTTGGAFAWYGIKGRPTTIIVDAKGRIVAATNPEDLTAIDLLAVFAGKTVKFPADINTELGTFREVAPTPARKPLFEVSLSKAVPDAKFWMRDHSTGLEIHGADAEYLLTYAYHQNKSRLLLDSPLPEGLYDLRAEFATADESASDPILQADVAAGLHLRIQQKTVTESVYVLRATDATRKLLMPTASNGGSMWGFRDGSLIIVSGSMDNVASALEDALETPLVNETGLDGRFDMNVLFFKDQAFEKAMRDAVQASDLNAARAAQLRQKALLEANFKAVLLKELGLVVREEDRPTSMLEVSGQEQSKLPAVSNPHPASKH
jgi:uncharacterized protein (TIGR03435 family)